MRPNDAEVVALLDAFRDEAEKRGTAAVNHANADSTIWLSAGAAVFGGASAVGGTIVAVPSCATVPLTFWAAGGTGCSCAGGVVAAVGGIGAFVVSAIVGVQAMGDKAEADEVFQAANQEANDLFDALKGYTGP